MNKKILIGIIVALFFLVNYAAAQGSVSDTLEEGESKTYNLDGIDYNVMVNTITDTSPYKVKFTINGEVTDALQEGEIYTLGSNAEITVISILPNEAGDVTSDIVTFTLTSLPGIYLTNEFNDYGFDNDGDGLFDYLVVEVGVDVKRAGNYEVFGFNTVNYDIYSYGEVYIEKGIQTVQLNFKGIKFSLNRFDGPYQFRIKLSDLDSSMLLDEYYYTTSTYSYTDFEHAEEYITPASISVINPIDGSTINTDSVLLDAATDDYAVCEYSLCNGDEWVNGNGSGSSMGCRESEYMTNNAPVSISTGDDYVYIRSSSDDLNLLEELGDVKWVIDRHELSILQSRTITNEKGAYTYDQYLIIGNSEAMFGISDEVGVVQDPALYLKAKQDTDFDTMEEGGELITYKLSFPTALKSDIDSNRDLDDLDNKNINILGTEYTVTNTDFSTEGMITIDLMAGTKTIQLQDSNIERNVPEDMTKLVINGNQISNAYVEIIGINTSNEVSIASIYIAWQLGSDYYIPIGGKLTDHLTEQDDIDMAKLFNIDFEFAGIEQGAMDIVEIIPSGSLNLKLKMTNKAGERISAEIFYTEGGVIYLAKDSNRHLHTNENDNIHDEEYFIVETNKYSHLMQVKKFDQTNSGITLKDVGSGDTETVAVSNGIAKFYKDGYEYILTVAPDYQSATLTEIAGDPGDTKADLWTEHEHKVELFDNQIKISEAPDVLRDDATTAKDIILIDISVVSGKITPNIIRTTSPIYNNLSEELKDPTIMLDSNYNMRQGMTRWGTLIEQDVSGDQDSIRITLPEKEAIANVYIGASYSVKEYGVSHSSLISDLTQTSENEWYETRVVCSDTYGNQDEAMSRFYVHFPKEDILYGDVSGNGYVSSYDASFILMHVAGSITLTEQQIIVGDVNLDGEITREDASLILKYVVGKVDKLPVEMPLEVEEPETEPEPVIEEQVDEEIEVIEEVIEETVSDTTESESIPEEPKGANLIVESYNVKPVNPTVGKEVTITATVKNVGNEVAFGERISKNFLIVSGANQFGISKMYKWNLGPDEVFDISWKFTPTNEGDNRIAIKIDDPDSVIGNRVPEYNTEDNIVRFDLHINGLSEPDSI